MEPSHISNAVYYLLICDTFVSLRLLTKVLQISNIVYQYLLTGHTNVTLIKTQKSARANSLLPLSSHTEFITCLTHEVFFPSSF